MFCRRPRGSFWDSLEVTPGIKDTAATHYSQHRAAFLITLLKAEPCAADGAIAGPGHGDTSAGGFWPSRAVAFTEWDGVSH